MPRKSTRKWGVRLSSCLLPVLAIFLLNAGEVGRCELPQSVGLRLVEDPAADSIATMEEARTVAHNWLRFVVERDGNWGGEEKPTIEALAELKRGDLTLGYYASVAPQGYVLISLLKDVAPIQAYSTDSDLDPETEGGMCDLLKDVTESRINCLIARYGALEKASPQDLRAPTLAVHRLAWSCLLEGGPSLVGDLRSIHQGNGDKRGPLLKTRWRQGPPYNNDFPDEDCNWPSYGHFNENPLTGCTALATAQVTRYYAWPPYHDSHYDWPNMLSRYAYDAASHWFLDEDGHAVTQAQIDAVAELLRDIDDSIWTNPLSGCDGRMHAVCSLWVDDARDALEDDFFYSSPEEDEPVCEERDSYGDDASDFLEWWNMIKREIDHNRPVLYRIASGAVFQSDFDHIIVVDGYDDAAGDHKIHANYGWDDGHTAWYTLDAWYCKEWDCSWDEEEMVRFIYPRNGLCVSHTGALGPKVGVTDLHHYVYCDVTLYDIPEDDTTVQAGAWLQFLPGTSITCGRDSVVDIHGRTPEETRFFSEGLPTRGLEVGAGGTIKMLPTGSIRVH